MPILRQNRAPGPCSRGLGEAGLEPGASGCSPPRPPRRRTLPSASLSLFPQTVAECVLYYYLTKKNENYKSLVRRSYRRRGKSQVRGGGGAGIRGAWPG